VIEQCSSVPDASALSAPEFEPEPRPPLPPGESPFLVSGLVYRSLVGFIDTTVPGGRGGLVAVLDPEVSDYLMQSFEMVSRFDALPLPCIALGIARIREVTFDEQLRDANRHAEARAGTVYRGILGVLSAEMVALAVPRAIAIVQLFGRTNTRVVAEGRVQGIRRGVPRTLVRWTSLSSAYYLESALVRAGAREPHVAFRTPILEGEVNGERTYALPFEITWQR
jgi:hypothetical protein